ncbi:TIGR03943 family putative permease subunit [Kitasatospora sp. NPDC058190]|uniref:TIGR03943 family putative permease subunit n=1 Tax=Kitasatospora sp. NPDC058190 TaxID=3346371 RepID=UPI0036DC4080
MAAVRRLLPAALLLLTGSALLRVSLLGNLYLRYVKEGLRPALIASGIVLVLLALVTAVRGIRPDEDEHDGHAHSAAGTRVAWLLAPPAAMLLLFAPPALGSYTVARDGSGVIAKRTTFPALPAQDPVPLSLTDTAGRTVWDGSQSLKGRTVRLTGFVTPVGATWQLSRIIVSCCAADARVVKVEIHGLPAPATDTWVTVTGVWRPSTGSPVLDATAMTPIARPDHPYRDPPQP